MRPFLAPRRAVVSTALLLVLAAASVACGDDRVAGADEANVTANAGAAFSVETVDKVHGGSLSLFADKGGAHLVYASTNAGGSDGKIKHATGATWTSKDLTAGTVALASVAAGAAKGEAHYAFVSRDLTPSASYARLAQGKWTVTPLAAPGASGFELHSASVAVDDKGAAHVVVTLQDPLGADSEIWLVDPKTGASEGTAPLAKGKRLFRPQLAYAKDGSAHVLYAADANKRLVHVSRGKAGGAWAEEDVVAGFAIQDANLVVAADDLHVVYAEATGGLGHAQKKGKTWEDSPIALEAFGIGGDHVRATALATAVDGAGRIHLAVEGGGDARELRYLSFDDDAWSPVVPFGEKTFGGQMPIAITTTDEDVVIAYQQPNPQTEQQEKEGVFPPMDVRIARRALR